MSRNLVTASGSVLWTVYNEKQKLAVYGFVRSEINNSLVNNLSDIIYKKLVIFTFKPPEESTNWLQMGENGEWIIKPNDIGQQMFYQHSQQIFIWEGNLSAYDMFVTKLSDVMSSQFEVSWQLGAINQISSQNCFVGFYFGQDRVLFAPVRYNKFLLYLRYPFNPYGGSINLNETNTQFYNTYGLFDHTKPFSFTMTAKRNEGNGLFRIDFKMNDVVVVASYEISQNLKFGLFVCNNVDAILCVKFKCIEKN